MTAQDRLCPEHANRAMPFCWDGGYPQLLLELDPHCPECRKYLTDAGGNGTIASGNSPDEGESDG